MADEICEGVRELVRRLQEAGFNTCDSGDGSHHAAGMACARAYPHVTMTVDVERMLSETQRLYKLLYSWDVVVYPIGTKDDLDRECAAIQLTYDPALHGWPGAACIDLMYVSDAVLREAEGLLGGGRQTADDPTWKQEYMRQVPPRVDSLGTALPREMARVRDQVIPVYLKIGPAGTFAVTWMRKALDDAAKAMAEGDLAGMIRAYEELKGAKT